MGRTLEVVVVPRLRLLIPLIAAAAVTAAFVLGCGGRGRSTDASLMGGGPPTAAARVSGPARLQTVEQLARYVVGAQADRSGATDPQYFAAGTWHNADGRCWYCAMGPGVTSAALWRYGVNDKSRDRFMRLARQTFDTLISAHQQPDGSFGPPLVGQEGNGIATMFAGNDLAAALIVLGPGLDRGTTQRWRSALERATRYVAGEFGDYYVNGNINVGLAMLAALTAHIAPTAEFRALEKSTRAFAFFPTTPQAAGFGLRFTREPARPDASDGSAMLLEKGGGGTGYDPEYTSLQADLVARNVALLRRGSDVRLLNLLGNQLRPSLDTETFELDTSAGTRHTQGDRRVPYLSPVPTVLAQRAGRKDFGRLAARQFPRVRQELLAQLGYSYDNMYRAVGTALGTALMAGEPR